MIGDEAVDCSQILPCQSKNFRPESFSILTSKGRATAFELVLLRGGLPSEIALHGGKPQVLNCVHFRS